LRTLREEKVCFHGGGEVSWVSGSVGGKPAFVAVVTCVLDRVAYGRKKSGPFDGSERGIDRDSQLRV